jgi:hypothetical protein
MGNTRYDAISRNRPLWFTTLANLKLFIVQYQTEVPRRSREFPENSTTRIGGLDHAEGKISARLKPGQTAYFGAWVEGLQETGEKGFFKPKPVYGPWCPEHAITFSVYMPERSDSVKSLNEQVEAEKAKAQVRKYQNLGVEKPRESITEREMRKYNQTRIVNNMKMDELTADMKRHESEQAALRRQIDTGEITPDRGAELMEDLDIAHEAYRDMIRNSMAG